MLSGHCVPVHPNRVRLGLATCLMGDLLSTGGSPREMRLLVRVLDCRVMHIDLREHRRFINAQFMLLISPLYRLVDVLLEFLRTLHQTEHPQLFISFSDSTRHSPAIGVISLLASSIGVVGLC